MDENLEFEKRVKELEREFGSSESQQSIDSKQPEFFNDRKYNLHAQSVTQNSANKKHQEGNFLNELKRVLANKMTWSIMTYTGLACFMLFFMSAVGHFILGIAFKDISFLSILALAFTFFPLIYFIALFFLKLSPNIESKPAGNRFTTQPFSSKAAPEVDDTPATANEESENETEHTPLENEKREKKQNNSKTKAESDRESTESEHRLLIERRTQIENLLNQEGMSISERNTLQDELENIENDIKILSVRLSAAPGSASQSSK